MDFIGLGASTCLAVLQRKPRISQEGGRAAVERAFCHDNHRAREIAAQKARFVIYVRVDAE